MEKSGIFFLRGISPNCSSFPFFYSFPFPLFVGFLTTALLRPIYPLLLRDFDTPPFPPLLIFLFPFRQIQLQLWERRKILNGSIPDDFFDIFMSKSEHSVQISDRIFSIKFVELFGGCPLNLARVHDRLPPFTLPKQRVSSIFICDASRITYR